MVLLEAPAVAPGLSLEAPAVGAPPQGLEVPAVAPPQDLVAPAVVAPALSLAAPALSPVVPAQVREGEVQGEAVQEGTERTGAIATEKTLGGTTGDGGGGRPSLR